MFHCSSNALHHPRQRRHLIRAIVGVSESTKFVILIPPTAVAKLLQYNGSRVEHRDEFSLYKRFAVKSKMVNLVWILGIYKNSGILVKTVRVGCVQIEIKMKKNKKRTP